MLATKKGFQRGPLALAIEKKFEEMTGKYALSLCSTTAAQLCGLRAWMDIYKIPQGAEVIVSGLELSSGTLNILQVGLVPVFADVDPDTLQPTIKTIQAAKTDKTVAVFVTHYAGYPCPIDDIWEWCKIRRYFLIDDASQCLSTIYKKWITGGWASDMTLFTFMDGYAHGAVVCFREETVAKCAVDHLLDAVWKEEQEHQVRGYAPELTEQDARYFTTTLASTAEFYVRRARVWDYYTRNLESLDEATLPWGDSKGIKQSCMTYPVRLERCRNDVFDEFRRLGYGMDRPYVPIYERSIWKLPKPELETIKEFSKTAVGLPIHQNISMVQAQQVVDIVKRVLK